MSNIKLYSITAEAFAVVNAMKLPLQQKQIYKSLMELGTPSRGVDVIDHAVKNNGLVTRQDYAVLAAWYFSSKRRPTEVTIGGTPTINVPMIENMNEVEAPAI